MIEKKRFFKTKLLLLALAFFYSQSLIPILADSSGSASTDNQFKTVDHSLLERSFIQQIDKDNQIRRYVMWPDEWEEVNGHHIPQEKLSKNFRDDFESWLSFMFPAKYIPDNVYKYSTFFRHKDRGLTYDRVYTRFETPEGTSYQIVQNPDHFGAVIDPPQEINSNITKQKLTKFVNATIGKYFKPDLRSSWKWKKKDSVWAAGKTIKDKHNDKIKKIWRENRLIISWRCCWYEDPALYTDGDKILIGTKRVILKEDWEKFFHPEKERNLSELWFEFDKEKYLEKKEK